MTIEAIEQSRTQVMPEGFTAEHDQDFGGSLVIRERGEVIDVDLRGEEKTLFKDVFGEAGIEIFNAWKLDQEGGES